MGAAPKPFDTLPSPQSTDQLMGESTQFVNVAAMRTVFDPGTTGASEKEAMTGAGGGDEAPPVPERSTNPNADAAPNADDARMILREPHDDRGLAASKAQGCGGSAQATMKAVTPTCK
jgi:hypothetical protein